jgi:dihydropyrimidinase
MKGRIDACRFVALTSTNHAKTYGLYPQKGTIAVGSDADITLWDPSVTRTVRHAELHDAADYSPYEGLQLTGWPVAVVLGGRLMMRNGELLGHRGDGQYRARDRSPLASTAANAMNDSEMLS